MAQDEVHVGDVGTVFTVTIQDGGTAVNLSGATTKEIVFKKPDGTVTAKAAAFATDGSDGKLTYTTVAGDLSLPGTWSIQGHVALASGEWRSDVGQFDVYRNLS